MLPWPLSLLLTRCCQRLRKLCRTPEGRVYSTYGSTVPTNCLVRVAAPVLLEYRPEELFSQIRVFSDSPFCQFVLMP